MALSRCQVWSFVFLIIIGILTRPALPADPNVVHVPEVDGVKLVCTHTVTTGQTVNWKGPDDSQLYDVNGTFTDSRLSFVDVKDLQIANAVPADNGIYTCVVDSQEGPVNLTVYVTDLPKLNISFVDEFLDSSRGVYQVRANGTQSNTFTCMIKGAFPQPTVSFTKMYHNDSLQMTVPSEDITVTATLESDNTYSVNAIATVELDNNTDNNRRMDCNAMFDIEGNTSTTTWSVRLYLIEVRPTIFVMNGVSTLSPRDNDLNVTCIGSRGRPSLDSIDFRLDGQPLAEPYNFTRTILTCMDIQEQQKYYTNLYECEAILMLKGLTPAVNGKLIGCSFVYQNEIVDSSHEMESLLDFRFPPSMVNITGNTHVEVSGFSTMDMTLTCTTDSSNGAATILWFNGTSRLNVTTDVTESPGNFNGVTVSQSLTIAVDRYMDGNTFRCEAAHVYIPLATENPSTSVALNVSYSPILVQPTSDTHRVYTGERISVSCSAEAKPVASTSWRRVYSVTNKTELVTAVGISTLDLQNVMLEHAGQYECEAFNMILPSVTKTITLIVYDKSSLQPFTVTTLTPSQSNIFFEFELPTDRQIRALYLQYSKLNDQGQAVFVRETQIPLNTSNNKVMVTVADLQPATTYEFQLREIDATYGLEAHSFLQSVRTSEPDEELTQSDINRAILISVFVTAAVVALICIAIFCLVRRGCSSSSKG